MGTEVLAALERFGPQTGAELVERTRLDVFRAWQDARSSPQIRFSASGSRFLRLDRAVPGFARLSPSIRREFLTYTVLGLEGQSAQIEAKAGLLREEIRKISRAKRDVAREAMESVLESLHDESLALEQVCFIIAGDIAYDMSHTVPRPERSTGQMVRGSDLDIIVVAQDGMHPHALNALDAAIHKRKHFLLVHPEYREEIDYLVKDITRVRAQLRFDTFEAMVACKILWEGEHLCGSRAVFDAVKRLVEEHGIAAKLNLLETQAWEHRAEAEGRLLLAEPGLGDSESLHLFYTREESEEIY
jgi:hypothetical protein